jgi:alpha-glucosidase (family GH31 glycosyl hydrolase)
MQRFPAVTWTGDGQSCTHEELLRGVLNGAPYTSCDLTSPDATTLVRQYQSAVFTPIMRVHMMQGTPRFPWFWPAKDQVGTGNFTEIFSAHQRAFRKALGMRYLFLPYLYSLAHQAHRHGRPIAHPASFAFPDDEHVMTAKTFMIGSALIPSDLVGLIHTSVKINTSSGMRPYQENVSLTYLPSGRKNNQHWYHWNTTVDLEGGQVVRATLALDEMAIFVRAGSIFPLNANRSIQYSAQTGGLLELQIYGGADTSFEMVEDDGISYAYRRSALVGTRTTFWNWDDSSRTLTWVAKGAAKQTYTHVTAILFSSEAKESQSSTTYTLDVRGSIVFPT